MHSSCIKSYTQIQGTNRQPTHLHADAGEHHITTLALQALFSAHQIAFQRSCTAIHLLLLRKLIVG